MNAAAQRLVESVAYSIELTLDHDYELRCHPGSEMFVNGDDSLCVIQLRKLPRTEQLPVYFPKVESVELQPLIVHATIYGVRATARVAVESLLGHHHTRGVQIG